MKPTDVAIREVETATHDYRYRTPIKFGGVALDRVTLLTVRVTIENRRGERQSGTSAMPLGNVWAWPSKTLNYHETLQAMLDVADECARLYRTCPIMAHPMEIGHTLEQELPTHVPPLAALVVHSPFDAALHDAYGKLYQRSIYDCYGPQFLTPDLGAFLGPEFAGETLDQYIRPTPAEQLPLYHLVGALDPLTPADVLHPVGDGLPETLGEWILSDGLTHLKIKLSGDDPAWDIERVRQVDQVAEQAAARDYRYSLDFNERCPNAEALLDFYRALQLAAPRAFERVQYVEQPTARDLHSTPNATMHAAAPIRPVVIDESLIGVESLELAQQMGYSGVAFKACKGQTQSLLLAALAQKRGLFRCVQDLTCVGASLIHSAGLAARIPGVVAIEANGRQYCPAANAGWSDNHPGIFTIRDGKMMTGTLHGPGLGGRL
jgi:L-alanine-DL-glutamate epimerase-like enolase superfamily enzyme